jgi:hypothetical protein
MIKFYKKYFVKFNLITFNKMNQPREEFENEILELIKNSYKKLEQEDDNEKNDAKYIGGLSIIDFLKTL